jgi:hypothetical protein
LCAKPFLDFRNLGTGTFFVYTPPYIPYPVYPKRGMEVSRRCDEMMIEEFWTEAEAEAAGCNIVPLSHHDGFHELTTQQFERLSRFRFLYFSCVRRGCYADGHKKPSVR